jgi:hypothetical protein
MPSKRRRRRTQEAGVLVDRRGRPVAAWKWLTFPVYFALSLGLIVGYNVGLIARSNPRLEQVATLVFSIPFAFGLAQLVTRPVTEMMLRRRSRLRERQRGQTPGQ